MTNPTPTDREAVERLADSYEVPGLPDDCRPARVAATLRALLAERDHAEAEKQAAVKAMREAAASWHDERVVEMKRQIEENNEHCAREGLTHSAANDYCRDSILNSRVAAQQIRSLPAPTDALDRAIEAERTRIADAIAYEASVLPCAEDAAVMASCAELVRANFSYDDAERTEYAAIRARPDKGEV